MSKPEYEKLMEPLMIRGHWLKNRLEVSNSLPHFLQGPEPYPADSVIAHFENKAKSAAIVTCMGINNGTAGKQLPMFIDFGHFPDFNLYDPCCQNYLLQLADAIHYHQSIACMTIFAGPPSDYPLMNYTKKSDRTKADDVYDSMDNEDMGMRGGPIMDEFTIEMVPAHLDPAEYTEEMLGKVAESIAEQAYLISRLDFDMVNIHMSYRGSLPSQMFSPLTNHRTDAYGGDYENRKWFPLMVLKRVRERVGNHVIIELQWTAQETELGGYDLDESVRFLNEAKEYIDIVQLRAYDVDPAHPTGFIPEETPCADQAGYIKARVPGLVVSTIGGNFYPGTCEKILADGKADIIAGARPYISNPEYGQLIKEGRADDIVPCLRCNKCHGRGPDDPFQSVCSVNPIIGLEQKVDRMIRPVREKKRVAIIGGGPAGMRCAIYLQDRGHTPVIFEASDSLGGTIRHADYASFKWPMRDFKNYLIYQMEKRSIDVRLNCRATPEIVQNEDFDAVVCAVGARPLLPPIRGVGNITPVYYDVAFAHPEKLGKNVAVIGGGDAGVEIGIHLVQHGCTAYVLEMRDRLAADATVMHYLSYLRNAWEKEENFHGITGATVRKVSEDGVTYLDQEGAEHFLKADSIVFSCGMKSCSEEALRFYGSAREFYVIGDAKRPATIQHAMRDAFAVAHSI